MLWSINIARKILVYRDFVSLCSTRIRDSTKTPESGGIRVRAPIGKGETENNVNEMVGGSVSGLIHEPGPSMQIICFSLPVRFLGREPVSFVPD